MNQIYKIDFYEGVDILNNYYHLMTDIEKQRISEFTAESVFEYEPDNKYSFFLISKPSELESYIKILKSNNIRHSVKNISNDILSGKYDIEFEMQENIDINNTVRYCLFIDDVNSWLSDNLDADLILDKISAYGINSLKKVEVDFLNNYSK